MKNVKRKIIELIVNIGQLKLFLSEAIHLFVSIVMLEHYQLISKCDIWPLVLLDYRSLTFSTINPCSTTF